MSRTPLGCPMMDGSIYYSVSSGPSEDRDLWRLSLADGAISRLTRLEGRRGLLGFSFAADARYLYFLWWEDDGDIWVMDVVPNADAMRAGAVSLRSRSDIAATRSARAAPSDRCS